jgi:hypothetical protein
VINSYASIKKFNKEWKEYSIVKKKYCTVYGKELRWIEGDFFDEDTGEKKMILERCPTRDRAHGNHSFSKRGFFKESSSCTRCGQLKYNILL